MKVIAFRATYRDVYDEPRRLLPSVRPPARAETGKEERVSRGEGDHNNHRAT